MRGLAVFAVLAVAGLACGSPAPTPTAPPASTATPPVPTPTDAPTPTVAATPTANVDLPTLALPEGVAGIPGSGDISVDLEAQTPAGSTPIGVDQNYTLGHCGLFTPIDINGSFWDPVAGDDGQGGPLTDDQLGELVNATPVVLVLVDADTALFVTPAGARILLERNEGSRAYFLCD